MPSPLQRIASLLSSAPHNSSHRLSTGHLAAAAGAEATPTSRSSSDKPPRPPRRHSAAVIRAHPPAVLNSLPALTSIKASLLSLARRAPDTHQLTRQGRHHAADSVANQDCAFCVERAPRAAPSADAPLALAAVLDGHGAQGAVASRLARDALEGALLTGLAEQADASLSDIARDAFRAVAAALDAADCAQDSGTTASVVVVGADELVVAFVGDSSVAIVADPAWGSGPMSHASKGDGVIRFLSRLHRVSEPDEARRVVAAGGTVQDGYVVDDGANNGIAVTRTLGDVDMHAYGCISEPEVQTLKRRRDDSAIILATDGLWDSPGVSLQDVAKVAAKRRGRSARRVCERLLELVEKGGGPYDDCTVVCITLN